MSAPIVLSILSGEPQLFDPAVTGQFAEEMATIAAVAQTPPWCGYIGRRGTVPVGFGGFAGPIDDQRVVEIGYLTFPMHEGTGVAKSVAHSMIEIAREHGALSVIAHTLCEENASTGVLRANGFARDGESFDNDEGVVWRWRLDL